MCVYVCLRVCVFACVCLCVHVRACACMHVCVCLFQNPVSYFLLQFLVNTTIIAVFQVGNNPIYDFFWLGYLHEESFQI